MNTELQLTPGQRLRLALYRDLLEATGEPRTALEVAREVEQWVVGDHPDPLPLMVETAEPHAAKAAADNGTNETDAPAAGDNDAGAEQRAPQASTRWKPERLLELERWCAAGKPFKEIAGHLGVSIATAQWAARRYGIAARWPRGRGGRLQYEPYPLDAPWPPPASDATASGAEGETTATPIDTIAAVVDAELRHTPCDLQPGQDLVPAAGQDEKPSRRKRSAAQESKAEERRALAEAMATATVPVTRAGDPAHAAIEDVVKWLQSRDYIVVPTKGGYLVDGRRHLKPDELVEWANGLRRRAGLEPFTVREAV